MGRRARGFSSRTELAEVATMGVCANLDVGDPHLAAVLQPVARAAWARVAEGGGPDEILREARRARRRLRLAVGATVERRFLDAVIAYARAERATASHGLVRSRGTGGDRST
jgi:hypothetical protein